MVIHNIGKVIRRVPVALDDDKVAALFVLLLVVPKHPVDDRHRLLAHLEADAVLLPGGCASGRFTEAQVPTVAWVSGPKASRKALLPLLFELFGLTEAAVGVSGVDELRRV
jgi:hypothetical protein